MSEDLANIALATLLALLAVVLLAIDFGLRLMLIALVTASVLVQA